MIAAGRHAPVAVVLAQDVKQKRVHVIVKCLMVQEKLGQQTQALTVHLVLLPIHLKHRQTGLRGSRILLLPTLRSRWWRPACITQGVGSHA